MKTQNISVIIPAFNEEHRIVKCLEALLPQIHSGDEVIVVDNNSTDKTVEICKSFNVKVIFEQKQGQVFAQAKGFESAKNNVIARIDADSIVAPDWADQIRSQFSNKSTQVVTGPGVSYDLVFNLIPSLIMGFWTFTTNKFVSGHYPIWGSNFAFTKDAWNKVKTHTRNRQDIWEDFELGIEFNRLGINVIYARNLIVGYSNENGAYSSVNKAISYQMRAPKTYWVCGYKLKALKSLIERITMILFVTPLYVLEFVSRNVLPKSFLNYSGIQTKARRLGFLLR